LQLLPVGGWGKPNYVPVIALCLPQIADRAPDPCQHDRGAEQLRAHGAPRLPPTSPSRAIRAALLPVVSYSRPRSPTSSPARWWWSRFSPSGHQPLLRAEQLNRDYTLVMGVTVFYGTLIMVLT
jgi:oligopeptide transport system permease protein